MTMQLHNRTYYETETPLKNQKTPNTLMKHLSKLLQRLRGCPQKNACPLHSTQSTTCTCGPYQYCGKYRAKLTA
ncbi:MAG: hypothetical protein NWE92_02800 [Candidatus Bathyarchaeota archaeon]|nr:hypothetical protein [Candidatus Bathyarchaeota archaeon]